MPLDPNIPELLSQARLYRPAGCYLGRSKDVINGDVQSMQKIGIKPIMDGCDDLFYRQIEMYGKKFG